MYAWHPTSSRVYPTGCLFIDTILCNQLKLVICVLFKIHCNHVIVHVITTPDLIICAYAPKHLIQIISFRHHVFEVKHFVCEHEVHYQLVIVAFGQICISAYMQRALVHTFCNILIGLTRRIYGMYNSNIGET